MAGPSHRESSPTVDFGGENRCIRKLQRKSKNQVSNHVNNALPVAFNDVFLLVYYTDSLFSFDVSFRALCYNSVPAHAVQCPS